MSIKRGIQALVALLVLAAVVVATVVITSRHDRTAAPDPSPTPSSSPTSTTTTAAPDPVPANGCLGGEDPSTAMLPAHREAPLTRQGAAAFTATYLRWAGERPHPVDDAKTVGEKVWADSIPKKDRRVDNIPATPVGQMSFAKAHYRIDEFDGDSARISMTPRWIESQADGTQTSRMYLFRFNLVVTDGHWQVAGSSLPSTSAAIKKMARSIEDHGLPFRGGC